MVGWHVFIKRRVGQDPGHPQAVRTVDLMPVLFDETIKKAWANGAANAVFRSRQRPLTVAVGFNPR